MTPFSLPNFTLDSYDSSISHFPDSPDKNKGIWKDANGKTFALIQLIDNEYWIHWLDLASFHLKIDENRVYGYIAKDVDPELVEDVYQRNILPYFLHLSGYEVLHASAIRTNEGVVAFCAVSGVGKSTLAYALSQLGYELWSDDALIIATSSTPIRVFKIPFYIRLLPDAYEILINETNSHLSASATPNLSASNKTEAELSKIFFIERIKESDINNIQEIRLLPLTEAFLLLIKNAYILENEDKNRKKQTLENYLDLVSKITIYKLLYPTGLYKLSDLIIEIDKLI